MSPSQPCREGTKQMLLGLYSSVRLELLQALALHRSVNARAENGPAKPFLWPAPHSCSSVPAPTASPPPLPLKGVLSSPWHQGWQPGPEDLRQGLGITGILPAPADGARAGGKEEVSSYPSSHPGLLLSRRSALSASHRTGMERFPVTSNSSFLP